MNSRIFYKLKKWLEKRAKILRRDEYLCQECKRYGKSTPASTVHHIIPLAWCLIYNVALALASMNLVSLCEKCHDRMHDRTNNKLTDAGIVWVKKLGQFGIDWINKYSHESW